MIDGTHVSAEATYKDGQITSNLTTLKNNVDTFIKKSSNQSTTPKKEVKKESTVKSSSPSKTVVIKDLQILDTKLNFAMMGHTGTLTLPEGITRINAYTFSGCKGFTGELRIPDSVVSVGEKSFFYSGIEEVVIAENLNYIGKGAFEGCPHPDSG